MADNHPIRIYVNEIGNRNTHRTMTGYYQLLKPETMVLLEINKRKITKEKNG